MLVRIHCFFFFFFFNDTATTEIYTLSLHDALPIWSITGTSAVRSEPNSSTTSDFGSAVIAPGPRSEEHTSELQSQSNLVCRLLLEKKKKKNKQLVMNTYRQLDPTPTCGRQPAV